MKAVSEICLDANVIGAALCPDEDNADAVRLLDLVAGDELVVWAPSLCQFEVTGILNKKYNRKLMTLAQTEAALRVYSRLPILFLWKSELINKAYAVQKRAGCSYYDATYLAAAMLKDVPLVTDDREILAKGARVYPRILNPRQMLRRLDD